MLDEIAPNHFNFSGVLVRYKSLRGQFRTIKCNNMKHILLRLFLATSFLAATNIKAQVFNFALSSSAPCLTMPGFVTLQAIQTASSAGATSYNWNVVGATASNVATWSNTVPSGSAASITFTACGTYSVYHYAYAAGNPIPINTAVQICTVNCAPSPTVSITSVLGNTLCASSTNTLVGSGAISYTWIPGNVVGASYVVSPGANTCYTVLGASANGCVGSATSCQTVMPAPVLTVVSTPSVICPGATATLVAVGASNYIWSNGSISSSIAVSPSTSVVYTLVGINANGCTVSIGTPVLVIAQPTVSFITAQTQTVCMGSSVLLGVGGANSYTWNVTPVVNTPTITVLSTVTAVYTVSYTSANACVGTDTFVVNPLNSCAVVWPGDADRDGSVTTSDVLELGLWAGSTGPARTATSIAWAGQTASAWTGTISTGWNRAHADCNGDGVVNTTDNGAITANFSFTHAFKSAQSSASPDIKLVPQYNVAYGGVWNKADVVLGDVGSSLTVYGVAFDINYDQLLVQPDSVKLVYVPSFMKLNNTTIDFAKDKFSNGKIYGATVRTDQMDVIANGKIAEFWYKVKTGLPQNTTLNLSVSNGLSVVKSGTKSTLATQTPLTLQVDNNALGIASLRNTGAVRVYPNPAKQHVALSAETGLHVKYTITDLTGRSLSAGDFETEIILNLAGFANGVYFVSLEANGEHTDFKLILQK